MLLDPKTITVRREARQRTELENLNELKASIQNQGQINPVIVRQDGDEIILIAGERRLRCCLELNRQVEVKFWNELTPTQSEIIELEENLKRTDLSWRDQVRAIMRVHRLRQNENNNWSMDKTAAELGFHPTYLSFVYNVSRHLDSPLLKDATSIKHAYALLQRQAERRAAAIVGEIAESSAEVFDLPPPKPSTGSANVASTSEPQTQASKGAAGTTSAPKAQAAPPPAPVLNLDFLTWAPKYIGPKFNLIHCDFPFGIKFTGGYGQEEDGIKYDSTEENYWELVNCLCDNTDRLASYSSHLIFWFSMTFYTETLKLLRGAGWKVQDHPLIWYKSDGQGIIPGRNEYPRRVYESALLASRGNRPLVKMVDNCKGAPRAHNSIHPSQKPEPVLRHFFEGVVDNTTDMLDPTCGSASALRAAEDVGARSVLGLEVNPDFAKAASAATQNARLLRRATR